MKKNKNQHIYLFFHFIWLFSTILFLSTSSFAANYYISAAGNDSNTGITPDQAWRTLERVNKFVPKPGDSILFCRGDEWQGTITVNMWGMEGRPVVYGAYGSGAKPKIYGSEIIKGWERHSAQIYKAKVNKEVGQLFVNGHRMKAARYPNSGYIFISETDGDKKITSDELIGNIDYTGSKWFGRTHYFAAPLFEVAGSQSKTLLMASGSRFPFKKGLGFFLMNKLEFLDQPGEWYFESTSNTIYLWFPKDSSPANSLVRGSVLSDGIHIENKRHISVNNLHFLHQMEQGIHVRNSSNLVISDNEITDAAGYGVYCETNATGFSIMNNVVEGVNHYGMFLRISHSLVTGNRISKIALFNQIGLTGTGNDNYGGGIYLAGEEGKNVVSYNRLTEIGYNGILFARPENIIEYNFIKDVCLLKSDMGGIYTSWYNKSASSGPEGSIVRNNIILNVVGEKYGYISKRNMGEGIYIDESAVGVIVENNTIAHCSNSGVKLHKTEGVVVQNNTIYDTRQGIYVLNSSGTGKNLITKNLLIAARDSDDYLKRQVHVNHSSGNAVYNRNHYINLFNEEEVFLNDSEYCDFNKWRTISLDGSDSYVKLAPLLYGDTEYLIYNDTAEEKKIILENHDLKNLNGEKAPGIIKLKPFTSQILLGSRLKNLMD